MESKGGMIMRGFREVGWVAAVAGTALGCYMVNLKVASERAALETVENRIVLAQRDIRVLQTEIGTRGRLEQLESWNVKVLALSAPQAQQFLEGEFQLATLTAPRETIDPAAPVVLAAAPRPQPEARQAEPAERAGGPTARDLMQVASLKRDLPEVAPAPAPKKAVDKPTPPNKAAVKVPAKAATAPVKKVEEAKPATAKVATANKAPARTGTKSGADPLAEPKAKSKDVKARQ